MRNKLMIESYHTSLLSHLTFMLLGSAAFGQTEMAPRTPIL